MRLYIYIFALLIPFSSHAQVAAVTDIYSKTITVYKQSDGSGGSKKYNRGDIILPTAQLSNPSDHGLVMLELRFKNGAEDPVIGWVRKRDVKTNKRVKVDIQSDCGKTLAKSAVVTRGTRGLGNRC